MLVIKVKSIKNLMSPLYTTTTRAFQLIHSDIWGPAYLSSSQGYKYYLSFVDDYTRYTWLYPLTLKSEAAKSVKHFIAMVHTQFKTKVDKFQTDWGGEFRPLVDYFKDLGIHFQHPCPHIHVQNGKVERKHQHIVETGLTLLAQAHMPLKFWWEAFLTAVHLINILPSPTLQNKCPHSLLYNTYLITRILEYLVVLAFPISDHITSISCN